MRYIGKIKSKNTLLKESFSHRNSLLQESVLKSNADVQNCNIYSIALYDAENSPLRKVDENDM